MSKVPPGHRGLLDAELTEKLDALRSELDAEDKAGPNVFVIWEAIGRVAARNQGCLDRGEPTFPMPEWVNDYLLRGSEKIERLWLGIEPDDNLERFWLGGAARRRCGEGTLPGPRR